MNDEIIEAEVVDEGEHACTTETPGKELALPDRCEWGEALGNSARDQAVVIPADSSEPIEVIKWPATSQLPLLYEKIKCSTVEIVTGGALDLWCDEEALIKGNPEFNPRASWILLRDSDNREQPILGNVVITSSEVDEEGETYGLTPAQANLIVEEVRAMPVEFPFAMALRWGMVKVKVLGE